MLARLLLTSLLPSLLRAQNTNDVCFCRPHKVCPTCPQRYDDKGKALTRQNNPGDPTGEDTPRECSGGQSNSTVFGGPDSCQVW